MFESYHSLVDMVDYFLGVTLVNDVEGEEESGLAPLNNSFHLVNGAWSSGLLVEELGLGIWLLPPNPPKKTTSSPPPLACLYIYRVPF
jgi:hypothetical protein